MVGRGTGDAVPLRAAGALIGPDGLAVRWTRIGCACGAAGGPTGFWGGDRLASTMLQKPPKRVCDPRMRDQSAVNARGGAVVVRRGEGTGRSTAPATPSSAPARGAPLRVEEWEE